MTEEEHEVLGVHFERFERALADGTIILVGPTLGPTNTGIAIFEAARRGSRAPVHGGGSGHRRRVRDRRAPTRSACRCFGARRPSGIDAGATIEPDDATAVVTHAGRTVPGQRHPGPIAHGRLYLRALVVLRSRLPSPDVRSHRERL